MSKRRVGIWTAFMVGATILTAVGLGIFIGLARPFARPAPEKPPAGLMERRQDDRQAPRNEPRPEQTRQPGTIEGPLLSQGRSWAYLFNSTGRFVYHCVPHPYMKASITVVNSSPERAAQADDAVRDNQGAGAVGSEGADRGRRTVAVAMRNYAFQPRDLTIEVGTTVEWTNFDPVPHNVVLQPAGP
ncbi:MAG: hypothetical protein HYY09_04665 [Firmicutes bacterium]|nr:hypothetical protein [Bacillota bacterium]